MRCFKTSLVSNDIYKGKESVYCVNALQKFRTHLNKKVHTSKEQLFFVIFHFEILLRSVHVLCCLLLILYKVNR